MTIILASSSPRRAELLKLAHVDFQVITAAIDEVRLTDEMPQAYIRRIAHQKADAAYRLLDKNSPHILLAADTIGVLDDDVLLKPKDYFDAQRMWRAMSGRCHEVWTAVCVQLVMGGRIYWQHQDISVTKVYFKKLSQAEMAYYWATGEPCDKAGAYAIQGYAASWVTRIDGDYSNVVGLPLVPTLQAIQVAWQQAALLNPL